MTAKIIELGVEQREDEHLSGPALCISCGHEWQAVVPVGVYSDFECPECGVMKGILKHGVVSDVYWTCGCGCHIFTVSGISHNIMCWQCGKAQEWK